MRKVSSKIPEPGTKAWKQAMTRALKTPGFNVTLSEDCKRINIPYDSFTEREEIQIKKAQCFLLENVK